MVPWKGQVTGRALAIAGLLLPAAPASAQQFQITQLTDVSFGTISSVATNRSASQTVCVYASLGRYSITARGSGASNAFTLGNTANSAQQLAYTVQWAFTGNQTTGTQLTAGQALSSPNSINILCSLGGLLASSASLIVTLPSANLSAAQAGSYTGILTLMVAPI
ncbi:MAG: hypothetical protein DI555_00925 [Novosphingobium pentaromativorans]|uniref:Spore coat protein U domain-containing protein n=1 Tax=Novosphingobium pentaromativorans TaxID=205844 RepID=A0A2W5NVN2_9SPHN|nr:hypothetical protein [Novosphingobium panipatense]PZQ57526.1 MAG: hypothetical protein DI555_00925 [Novosphingobium pentaromativorans]